MVFKLAVWAILTNYMTMIETIVTNTKSRRNIKYLFKNNNNKTPNAINYHGGLLSTPWTYLMSLSLWHDSEFIPCNCPTESKSSFWMSSFEFWATATRTYYLWGCNCVSRKSSFKYSLVFRYSRMINFIHHENEEMIVAVNAIYAIS